MPATGGDGGLLQQDQRYHDHHGDQQHRAEPEAAGNGGENVLIDLAAHGAACVAQAVDEEKDQRDQVSRPRGEQRVADALQQRHIAHGGCDNGRVGQGRDLVAEERAGAHSACRCRERDAETLHHAHAGHAHSGQCAPGGARHGGHQGAEDAHHRQEQPRRQHLHAVVDHHRHRAAGHPDAHQNTHGQQDQNGHDHGGYRVLDALL